MTHIPAHLRPFEIKASGKGKIGITRGRKLLQKMLQKYPETEIPILMSGRLLPSHDGEKKGQVVFDIELDTFEIIGGKSHLAYTEDVGIIYNRDRKPPKKKENST
jgi:hypothetical protein